jgi:DNA segregation ATPase FtsK/SpoIIIE-like protein
MLTAIDRDAPSSATQRRNGHERHHLLLLHLTRAPFPHLFIVIDEYAEMIDDNPEYKAELESITRVGRSIGVNLILASQRPKGVTDQMRANIKLRICLRVEEMDSSRELLRRPDAALLPSGMPGRGYLQIGNENPELIQVSYTGDPQPDDRPAAVVWPARTAMLPAAIDEAPKFYDMVVQLAASQPMAPKRVLPDNSLKARCLTPKATSQAS